MILIPEAMPLWKTEFPNWVVFGNYLTSRSPNPVCCINLGKLLFLNKLCWAECGSFLSKI